MSKKDVFAWLKIGTKTLEVRKGSAKTGNSAVFQCGPNCLEMHIIKTETGKMNEIINCNNYKKVIPSAKNLDEAISYLREIYTFNEADIFTAYYLCKNE